ncbi:hypothetical protein DSM104299_03202 [Baekduia alba]|nr:hypothetical protein DSM104299_03202 [Baekduia alba]
MCRCGHTAHWHSHGGTGDCEFNRVCGCTAFGASAPATPVVLEMWICPTCGLTNNPWQHVSKEKWDPTIPPDQLKDEDWCPDRPVKVRVFREEDVRPLVEATRAAADAHPLDIDQPRLAAVSGPFPAEWGT